MAKIMNAPALKNNQRHWLLLRKVDDSRTVAFIVTVSIEEDPEHRGSYGATIEQLPGTVNAVESSGFAAEEAALTLFREMVDHCLKENIALSELLSGAVKDIMTEFEMPVNEVWKTLNQAIKKLGKGKAAVGASEWFQLAA